MNVIRVKSLRGSYGVYVGGGLLFRAGRILNSLGLRGKVMVVTQAKIARFYFKRVREALCAAGYRVFLHRVPEGEQAKSQKELFGIYQTLLENGFERRDIIFALGGGVVGDLAGYAAASYLRGVPFVNAGTTLLAQVDSSIGGKTGINLPEGKNLVGAFHPPRAVLSDTGVLKTLPPRELSAALAEAVKYGVIRDLEFFGTLEAKKLEIKAGNPALLEKVVLTSAKIKAETVGRDEFESGTERMTLNFGHTFGHGFEQAAGYRKLLHGEAVSIGMVCASRLAVRAGLFASSEAWRIENLLAGLGLPVSLESFRLRTSRVLAAMRRDKKKKSGSLRFILPVKIGKVTVRQDFPEKMLEAVMLSAGGRMP
jgi:3-dehydroquinate synthase